MAEGVSMGVGWGSLPPETPQERLLSCPLPAHHQCCPGAFSSLDFSLKIHEIHALRISENTTPPNTIQGKKKSLLSELKSRTLVHLAQLSWREEASRPRCRRSHMWGAARATGTGVLVCSPSCFSPSLLFTLGGPAGAASFRG